jgi:hypothetical protein
MMGSMALLISVALADQVTLERVSGGGSNAAAPDVRLSGAISAYGLPDGYAGQSRSASTVLGVGFYPALATKPAIIPRNGADPAWLALDEARDRRADATARPGPWRAPGQKPMPVSLSKKRGNLP